MINERRLVNDEDLNQPWKKDKHLQSGIKIYFGDNNQFSIYYDSTNNVWVVRDEVNGTEYTFPVNVNMDVSAHGARHDRGGADSFDYSLISNLADSGDVACAVGTGGTASTTTVFTLPAGWTNVLPMAVEMVVGGTVATGETVTITVNAVLDDGTKLKIASYSTTGATGSSTVGADTIWATLLGSAKSAGVSLDGRRLTSIEADVASSATSTSATATVRVIGART